jgi:hypothetical protein
MVMASQKFSQLQLPPEHKIKSLTLNRIIMKMEMNPEKMARMMMEAELEIRIRTRGGPRMM